MVLDAAEHGVFLPNAEEVFNKVEGHQRDSDNSYDDVYSDEYGEDNDNNVDDNISDFYDNNENL